MWSSLLNSVKELRASLLVAFLAGLGCNLVLRRRGQPISDAVPGTSRARSHRFVLPPSDGMQELPLDIYIASAPDAREGNEGPDLFLYVLDPQPILFGAAALFAYGQANYFKGEDGDEAAFRRMHVVGVGHARESFGLSESGFESKALRDIRRRDFPPFVHHTLLQQPGRVRNPHAHRFATTLVDDIVPFVEQSLGVNSATPPIRCLLGASYSAVMALQVLQARPTCFQSFVLASPSVCFDPEILEDLSSHSYALAATKAQVGLQILLGERETEGVAVPGNVHSEMASFTYRLAGVLRDRGLEVDGVNILPEEDHTSLKLALVGRGMSWFASRVGKLAS